MAKRIKPKSAKKRNKKAVKEHSLERSLLLVFGILAGLLAILILYLYLPPFSLAVWRLFEWNILTIFLFVLGFYFLWRAKKRWPSLLLAYSLLFVLIYFILGYLNLGGNLIGYALDQRPWIFPLVSFIVLALILYLLFAPLLKARGKKERKVVPLARTKPKPQIKREAEPEMASSGKVNYTLPPLDILRKPAVDSGKVPRRETKNISQLLEEKLRSFGIGTHVVGIEVGPAVTRYELELDPGVRVAKVLSLADDIALALASPGIRIETPIPGKPLIGIEVPLEKTAIVSLREILESEEFQRAKTKLPLALGKDISGHVVVADLRDMPHLLVAGATGSGKSVCINSLICGLLFCSTPDDMRLILIDPKRVELYNYQQLPHLFYPLVMDVKQAAAVLREVVKEMEDRLAHFSEIGARDIEAYNHKVRENGGQTLPYIVLMIDELADLMMVAPAEVEQNICRLAQLARATGIHLVLVTQRPSTDVITGLIKANIPSRISFSVASQTDSRVILDMGGAEKLLGRGDMLFYPVGYTRPVRLQGAYITEEEINSVVEFWKNQVPEVTYRPLPQFEEEEEGLQETDSLFADAVRIVLQAGEGSASMLQTKMKIGYARARRLIEQMEERGIVGPAVGSKPRKVIHPDQGSFKFK